MQRFLSLKLFSKNHNTINTTSYIFSTFVSKIKTNPLQYSTATLTNAPAKPKIYFEFLSNPVLLNKIFQRSNAMLKAQNKGILDFKWVFSRSYSSQKCPHYSSSYNSLSSFRKWLQKTDPHNLVRGLIAANIAVFLLFRKASSQFKRENFMISLDNLKSGRLHTLVTSAFSHMDGGHLISNMIGLYIFGKRIGRAFGPEILLKLYLAGALVGSVFHLVYHAYKNPSKSKQMGDMSPSSMPGLGTSGAVTAIMLLDLYLTPKMLIIGLPCPVFLLGIYLIMNDMSRIIEGDTRVSRSAHLGGAAVAWALCRKNYRKLDFRY
ncbi:RHOMBOID-like protein 12, mitochondrial [Apium graveolens]|uniref:RHOMBOID-like protein 12, mitochondrial n=1 Tax=Apium graveolens TaxID=4045 RepID=UPI003D7BCDA6